MDIKQYNLFIGIKHSTAKVSFSESHELKDNTASVTEGVPGFVSNIKQRNNNNNNNNNVYLLQLGCYSVALAILHVNKT